MSVKTNTSSVTTFVESLFLIHGCPVVRIYLWESCGTKNCLVYMDFLVVDM